MEWRRPSFYSSIYITRLRNLSSRKNTCFSQLGDLRAQTTPLQRRLNSTSSFKPTKERRKWHDTFGTMTSQRILQLSSVLAHDAKLMSKKYAFQIFGKTRSFSPAEIAGHLSFVFLATSYLENEFVQLRILAIMGLTSMSVFQYYRPQPLWLPLKWNIVFILINAGMLTYTLYHESSIKRIESSERRTFEKVFKERGFSAIEYLTLRKAATLKTTHSGNTMTAFNRTQNKLRLIVSGTVDVSVDGNIVSSLTHYQFMGEMSLLQYMNDPTEYPLASAKITAHSDTTYYEWDFDKLQEIFQYYPELRHKLKSVFANDLMLKLAHRNNIPLRLKEYNCLLENSLKVGYVDASTHSTLRNYRNKHKISRKSHAKLLERAGWTEEDFALGYH